ncbi:MAG: AAA family ATPase [Thermodesulfobacteriota bacterium]
MTENEKLRRAIAHLEDQRSILGDDAVQAASKVLLQRLAALNSAEPDASRREQQRTSSRLIGRQAELRAIRRRFELMLEGQGRFISVIGEAGIGKSRLIAELRKQVIGSDTYPPIQWLEASASSMGKGASYWLFRQLIWAYAGITEQDDEDDVWHKLRVRVGALFENGTAQILPCLATMISLDVREEFAEPIRYLKGEAMRRQVFLSSQLLFEKIAQTRPLVLVFEDVQWIDESSADLLQHLLPLLHRAPILMLGVSRPALEGPQPQLLLRLTEAYYDRYDEIHLQPLSSSQSAALVDSLLHNESRTSAFRDKIIDKAGGNPFFIEEIVRSLTDEGLLYRDSSSNEWCAAAEIETTNVPRTIQDTIMARVNLLDKPLKELVKVAAVVGRRVLYRLLLAVVQPAPELAKQLATLERLGLILEDTRTSESAYMFNHDLTHEAIYENLDDSERKRLHARVGSAVEQIFADRLEEFLGLLAYHYSRAEVWEKAEECLIVAGEQALKSAASDEALHYYQEALSIYRMRRGDSADPEKIAMLEKNIGLALFNRGYYAEAVKYFDEALNYYWGELPKNPLSTAFRFLSSFMTFLLALYFPSRWFKRPPTQRDAETVDLFYKRAGALVVTNPKRFFVESFFFYDTIVHLDLTKLKFGMGIFVGASAFFSFTGLSLSIGKRILDYAKPRLASDDVRQWIMYDLMETQHLFLKGQWNAIKEYDEDLVNRGLRIGETWDAGHHYAWHGLPKVYQGHFGAARLMVSKLSEIAEAYENDICRLFKYLLNICLLIESRHMEAATDEVNRGIDFVQKKGWRTSTFTMHSLEALTHLFLKETEEARKSLDQANKIRSKVKVAPIQLSIFYRSKFEYHLCLLEDSLRRDHWKGSSEHRRDAFKSGKMLIKTCRKAALYRTDSYRLMGVYHWLTGDRKSAFEWWHKAIKEGESLGARPELARTYAEVGLRLHPTDGVSSGLDANRAEDLLRKAETMFRDMSLHHDLEALHSAPYRTGRDPAHI